MPKALTDYQGRCGGCSHYHPSGLMWSGIPVKRGHCDVCSTAEFNYRGKMDDGFVIYRAHHSDLRQASQKACGKFEFTECADDG